MSITYFHPNFRNSTVRALFCTIYTTLSIFLYFLTSLVIDDSNDLRWQYTIEDKSIFSYRCFRQLQFLVGGDMPRESTSTLEEVQDSEEVHAAVEDLETDTPILFPSLASDNSVVFSMLENDTARQVIIIFAFLIISGWRGEQ